MSTNFFERQADARKNSGRLVALFLIAVVLIVATTSGIAYFGAQIYVDANRSSSIDPHLPVYVTLAVGLGTFLMIVGGTAFKILGLRMGGGRGVAESLGGTQLSPDSQGIDERRILNVVEEMAIASGTPVPPVYLMEEDSINAFAAGYTPSDAVIGVTRGAVQNLTRDQLQGVIAHEFSHILNGDMRMNIRLIGILNGILLLHITGSMLIRSLHYTGRSRSRGSGNNNNGQAIVVILAIGFALFLIGYIGHLLGGLIKAAVSRQREYLADASAVQFTRNPNGIGGALKAIGAISYGSKLEHPGAEIASHMYFASGFAAGFSRLTATHPPLDKRIFAIDPKWDGQYPPIQSDARTTTSGRPQSVSQFAGEGSVRRTVPIAEFQSATEHIGAPDQEHRTQAVQLISSMPEALVDAAHEVYSARAVIFALLLDPDKQIRQKQLQALSELCERPLIDLTQHLWRFTGQLAAQYRLPLLDMTIPALCMMSSPQYVAFMRAFAALADADDRHSVFEWTLAQILIRHLKPHFVPNKPPIVTHLSLKGLMNETSVLLSIMSRVGHGSEWVESSFVAGQKLLGVPATLLPASDCSLTALHNALTNLRKTSAKIRGRLIDACTHTISADGKVTVTEAELLRGIADLLDCPVPPWDTIADD